ncbi:hypothetical protein EDD22DRAFT_958782 [Suillus occidentalis]|nr:hypothetical protein EDD22DRAFT_958782 [Suillus occidentalis]
MSSNDSIAVMGIWADDRNSIQNTLPGHHRVEEAVGILQIHMSRRVTSMYGLEPPLDPLAMRAKYHPEVEPSETLSICRSVGLTAIFTPNPETELLIKAKLAQSARANQTSMEPKPTLATGTAIISPSSTSATPSRKAKKAKKRNAASTADTTLANTTSTNNTTSMANPALTTNLPYVAMDSQLKEVLASMQKEMAEMRGNTERVLAENERILAQNERILAENESMRGEIKSMCGEIERLSNEKEGLRGHIKSMRSEIERLSNENEGLREGNERINNDLASVRKDLDTARVTHTQDVEALRIVTLSLIPLHLRVLLDHARSKILEHLGHESWEGLRKDSNVDQLSIKIFNGLKGKGVSYTPPHSSILFLCSYNNIRRAGNLAAHTANEEEVRHAVLAQPLESR